MSLFAKLFGSGEQKNPAPKQDMKEQALSAIDSMNAQIAALEANPDLPEAQKAEQIAALKQEIRRFSESMGWIYNE